MQMMNPGAQDVEAPKNNGPVVLKGEAEGMYEQELKPQE